MNLASGMLLALLTVAHPWILALGAALTSIPLLIHWFSRRRVRTIEWAAFEFLLGAQRRDQRRVRIEDWLLVALRCLLVLLFAMLVARPLLRGATPSLAGSTASAEHILILDDSRSMRTNVGNETAWDRARSHLLAYCQERTQDRSLDTLSVWVTSRPSEPLFTDMPLTSDRVTELARRLESLPPNDSATPFGVALRQIGDQLMRRSTKPDQQVVAWTDLRLGDWPTDVHDEHPEPTLAAWARSGWRCRVVDCGAGATGNLRITDCRWEPIVWDDVPTRCLVTVHNAGAAAAQQVQLQFTIDGSLPISQTIEELAADAMVTVEFPVTFGAAGLAPSDSDRVKGPAIAAEPARRDVPVELRLVSSNPATDNRLSADDAWDMSIAVYAPLSIVVVEGESSGRDERGDGFFLERALAPDGGGSGFVPRLLAERELADASYAASAVVVLANVVRLQDAAVERLKTWVEGGGNLVVLAGAHTDRVWHNERLGPRGAALVPFELVEVQGDDSRRTWQSLEIADTAGSPLVELAGADNPLMNRVQLYRWWSTQRSDLPNSSDSTDSFDSRPQILATLRNAERTPVIGIVRRGAGRVVEVAWSADTAWSNWPTEPSFVVFFQQLAAWLAASRWDRPATLVGSSFRKSLDLATFEPHAALRAADQRYSPVTATAVEDQGESTPRVWQLVAPPADVAGIYTWELTTTDGRIVRESHNVFADPREGELTRGDVAAWRRKLNAAEVEFQAADEVGRTERASGEQELLGWIGWLALALLVGEPWWAWHMGKRR